MEDGVSASGDGALGHWSGGGCAPLLNWPWTGLLPGIKVTSADAYDSRRSL
jgi:hypothetical protein